MSMKTERKEDCWAKRKRDEREERCAFQIRLWSAQLFIAPKLSDMTDSPFIWLYFSRVAKFRHSTPHTRKDSPLAAHSPLCAVVCFICINLEYQSKLKIEKSLLASPRPEEESAHKRHPTPTPQNPGEQNKRIPNQKFILCKHSKSKIENLKLCLWTVNISNIGPRKKRYS